MILKLFDAATTTEGSNSNVNKNTNVFFNLLPKSNIKFP